MLRALRVLKDSLPYQDKNPEIAQASSELIDALDRDLTSHGYEEGEGDEVDQATSSLEEALNTADVDSELAEDDDIDEIE